jgi:hypothetical protein
MPQVMTMTLRQIRLMSLLSLLSMIFVGKLVVS